MVPPVATPAASSPRLDRALLVGAWVVLVAALAAALGNIVAGQGALERHMRDVYYYFEAADNVRRFGLPRIDWPQGPDDKFFPGYGVALGLWSAATGTDPWVAWRSLQVALVVVIAGLAVAFYRQLGLPGWRAVAVAALMASNPALQRWAAVPYSEPLCLALLLAGGVVALTPQWRGRALAGSWGGAAAIGVLGGLAAATRIEGLVLQAPLLLAAWHVGGLRAWPRLALAAALIVAPLGAWLLAFAGNDALPHYVVEAGTFFNASATFNKFWTTIANSVRYFQLQTGQLWTHLGYWVAWHLYIMAIIVGLRGVLGPRPAAWTWTLLGYCLLHGLWHYESDRYVVVILPLVYAVLWAGAEWLVARATPGGPLAPRAAVLLAAAITFQVAVHGASRFVIDDHVAAINSSRSDADHATIAAMLPEQALVLTDLGPELALWHDGPTWFVPTDPLLWSGLEDQGGPAYERLLADHAPGNRVAVVLEHPLEHYPALAAALARRNAVEQPAPAEGVRLWTLAPAAGGASQ